MNDPIILVPYEYRWPNQFIKLATPIRKSLGVTALRIDHIGSTAIPGLLSKPVIDIQIAVESFEPFSNIRDPLESLHYRWRPDNPDRSKRYFREPIGSARIHVHVRILGTWQQQLPLLFRDYLRSHPDELKVYEQAKTDLAKQFRNNRSEYVKGKDPVIWQILRRATEWIQQTAWEPGPSDL
ncbi:MAG: GrpB family protein [Spirochaetales bacterium]|jgi:GrpB-like predicted nucleotidyltransferase (UPF0157 family)|nr:GrpB family protein [Spirochaetales bacterium]